MLLVTVSHAGVPLLKYGGIAGVTLFFVLSGYLITSILLREHDSTGAISLRSFYMRRVLRLLPALFVALAVGSVLFLALGESVKSTLFAAGAGSLYMADIAGPLGWVHLGPFATYWSLAVEEQYYLVWPLLLLLLLRHARREWVIFFTLVLATASLASRFAGPITTPHGYGIASYFFTTNVWAILLGSALALFLTVRKRVALPPWAPMSAAIVLLSASSVLGLRHGLHDQANATTYIVRLGVAPIAAACGLVLVLACLDATPTWVNLPILRFFGRISYALYLFMGILDYTFGRLIGDSGFRGLVAGSISAVLATGLAVVSWKYVESPFMRRKARYESSPR